MNDLNFLRLIFELGGSFQNVNNIDLAVKANVSKASISDRTQHLAKLGLVKYTKYYGTKLTKKGLNNVIPLVQQHRLIETWLYEKLSIPLNDIYEKATKLSDHPDLLLIDRLNIYLDYPKVCPHGNVIPINCSIPEFSKYSLLANQEISETTFKIINFTEDNYLFQILNNIDINLDDKIQILNINSYDHSMVVLNLRNNLKQILPKNITKMIRIEKINEMEKSV
ncbi:Cro/Cl family transcriptional regulator [Companilactobacillus crustorum]|uniref:Cro/Cl family transcriptional regulator n=1 Tax=Companilactobacillus crustorum TaxID=392416 RepID=A0AB34AD07_9LACO|nr:metal-dependent transcriptional regulator [Companilactobacillus crustorum]WDT65841.1 metal-dependent transcriptional regulator [Companilactobacillus crustorum]GEO76778.1 Cro/Cl family transcriptional regulator [Companilactobacillus crustorum]